MRGGWCTRSTVLYGGVVAPDPGSGHVRSPPTGVQVHDTTHLADVVLAVRSSPSSRHDEQEAALIGVLDELAGRAHASAADFGDGRELRSIRWAEQDPYVVRLLADAARAYLRLDAEHRHAELMRRGLEHVATHDALTGLPNRVLLLDRIQDALGSAGHGGCVAVLFVDIDGFKLINDTLGHAAGDIVLTEVAARLRGATRDGDTVGRMSGDEFVVVCPNLTGTQEQMVSTLHDLGRRVATALRRPSPGGVREVVVSASVGAAIAVPTPGAPATADRLRSDAADLLDRADGAMYASKRAGKGRLTIAAPERGLHLVRRPDRGARDQQARTDDRDAARG